MRADRIHVAVRPRGILECLDLAVMFCGRRFAAVAVATMLGAMPCILVNRLLIGDEVEVGTAAFAAYLLLGLEAAWASVPLTLYLGQAVFSDRFSWRLAARAFLGSLPAMIVFQGILRGICLLVYLLVPVVFVGMYYLDQVILLDQPGFTRVWSRRTAINRGQSLRIASLALLDASVLVIGVPLGTRLLGAVSAVWQGRPVSWLATDEAGGFFGAAIFSWHGQIAFWSVCGLLTVFRFFTYLDARIRREGWDVELKLRADATYAGLEATAVRGTRSSGDGRLAGMAGGMLLLVALGGALAAADARGDGTGGREARRALARQSFPWYDADQDRFRPLIRSASEREAEASVDSASHRSDPGRSTGGGAIRGSGEGPASGSGNGPGDDDGGRPRSSPRLPVAPPLVDLGGLGWILMIGLLVAAILSAIYIVVRFGLGNPGDPRAEGDSDRVIEDLDEERLAALPEAARITGGDLLARAAASAERGEFEQAVLFFHAWQLLEFDRRGILTLARGKTNGHYAGEVAAVTPGLAPVFRRSCRLFEDTFFGELPVLRQDFLAIWNERDRMLAAGRTTGD